MSGASSLSILAVRLRLVSAFLPYFLVELGQHPFYTIIPFSQISIGPCHPVKSGLHLTGIERMLCIYLLGVYPVEATNP